MLQIPHHLILRIGRKLRPIPPRLQPLQHLRRTPIRRKHGVKNLHNPPILHNQSKPLNQRQPIKLKRRQLQRLHQLQLLVAEELVGEVDALFEFLLVGCILRAYREDVGDAVG